MKYIDILPMGSIKPDILDLISQNLAKLFPYGIRTLKPLKEPIYAFNFIRNQYFSSKILSEIVNHTSEETVKILGVVDVDLYIPIFCFVFGEAQLRGKAAVISLHRLRPEFYGLEPNKELLYERVIKESIHELGHNFGLTHCLDENCVMYFSHSIWHTDVKKSCFCEECQRIINHRFVLQEEA